MYSKLFLDLCSLWEVLQFHIANWRAASDFDNFYSWISNKILGKENMEMQYRKGTFEFLSLIKLIGKKGVETF